MAAVTSQIPWILRRPTTTTGWVGWLVTVDHKRIGVLYGVTAVVFFLIGGIEALTLSLPPQKAPWLARTCSASCSPCMR